MRLLVDLKVADVLPGFDILVSSGTARSEGLPTVILEAMAAGLPVVATDVGSTSEIVDDGVTGYVIEPGNPGGIAEGILRLARNSDLREQMANAARSKVRKEWPIETCVDTYVRAYRLAILHHESPRRR